VTPGQVSTLAFTPQQVGSFMISCDMGMMNPGTLIVTQ
jgi:plastocyanin domain-containing protein